MRTLETLSPAIESISGLKYFSKSSFLFIASPHIMVKIYLLLKVLASKNLALTTFTMDSYFSRS
jgi:hypothetical protein